MWTGGGLGGELGSEGRWGWEMQEDVEREQGKGGVLSRGGKFRLRQEICLARVGGEKGIYACKVNKKKCKYTQLDL